jgi:hypothetical protein
MSFSLFIPPESNCVFLLCKLGLVVIEHPERRDHFMIVRPASLSGATFRSWQSGCNVGFARASLKTNAPPAMLQPCENGWVVDISVGNGPVWLHEEFEKARDAVEAIKEFFFRDHVDNR